MGGGKYSLHLEAEPTCVYAEKNEEETKARENTGEESPFKFTFKENHEL